MRAVQSAEVCKYCYPSAGWSLIAGLARLTEPEGATATFGACATTMQELITAIPDVDTLLALEPEELGAKLLFILRGRREAQFHPGNLKSDVIRISENTRALL
jgi:hypothetical protein